MNLKDSLKALKKVASETEDGELGGMLYDILDVYQEAAEADGEEDGE